jgi:hypothetical protein
VREVAGGQFRLLEALDRDRRHARRALRPTSGRVRKPDVRPGGIDVEFAAVTVER